MTKKLLLILVCVVLLLPHSSAQTADNSVTGTIKDATNKPIAYANVLLLKATDSVLVKGAVTDTGGNYSIENISDGNYIISSAYLGMIKNYSKPFSLSGNEKHDMGTLILSSNSKKLSEVNITAQKPLFEQKPGMTVVNVNSNPTTVGNSAWEVLQKSPGIVTDNNNNIILKGKTGVTVMIDDKPTYLSATDLYNLLKNMPATAIDQIEIMTIPPAKYDAAGSGGVINIKLKKNTAMGLNGSIVAGYRQGIYSNYSVGFNFNYRTDKFNFFGNYMFTDYTDLNHNFLTRKFSDSGQISSIFNQNFYIKTPGTLHTFKGGVDYYLDKKTTIGLMVNGSSNDGTNSIFNVTHITNPDNTPQSGNISYENYHTLFNNVTYDLNLNHKIDTSGTILSGNFDYARFNSNSNQSFLTDYFNAEGEPVYPSDVKNGLLPSITDIISGKFDLDHPFKNGIKLEAGVKSSYVTSDNNVQYNNFINDVWVIDTGTTNHFKYSENINAAYVDLSKDFKKGWSLEAGLRAEQTLSKGNQVTIDSSFTKNYLQLFPTLFIKKDINKNNEFTLSFARRIDRPNYQDLNPFRFYLDPYTYQEGNPYLQPQFTNDLELGYTYKNFLTTTISISQTNNVISDVLSQIDSADITFQTKDNLATFNNIGISESATIPLTKWLITNDFIDVYYNQYKGYYLNGNLNLGIWSATFTSDNEFIVTKTFSIDASGEYDGPFVYGILVGKPSGFVSIRFKKTLCHGHIDAKLNFNDIFYTSFFSGTVNYQDINLNIISKGDSRNFALNLTYHFGHSNQRTNHTTGIEDEKKRVKKEG